jgi:hypothetical protein
VPVLGGVVDPRVRRGMRHRLVTVLAVSICAVAAPGRWSASREWAADSPGEVAAVLGVGGRALW